MSDSEVPAPEKKRGRGAAKAKAMPIKNEKAAEVSMVVELVDKITSIQPLSPRHAINVTLNYFLIR